MLNPSSSIERPIKLGNSSIRSLDPNLILNLQHVPNPQPFYLHLTSLLKATIPSSSRQWVVFNTMKVLL